MATYTLFTASYGLNYANLRVRILEASTGVPAIIMASATSGLLSIHGNAATDPSGNLSVYIDSSKTFQVWNNQFLLLPSGISIATDVLRTATQLANPPTLSDIGLGPGATFYLDTNPTSLYRISTDKTQYILVTSVSDGIGLSTSSMIKGDGIGGALNAIINVDYAPGVSIQCNVPIGNAPSGTIGSNGALTLGTALVGSTVSGWYDRGIWLNYPANAITGSNGAGYYWTVFTSATAATVYNNTYTPGSNVGAGSWRIPTTSAFTGTTGAAYTGVTTATSTHSLSIAGNTLGSHGQIQINVTHRNNGTAGAKAVSTLLGGSAIGYLTSQTTNTFNTDSALIYNQGATDRQYSAFTSSAHGTSGGQARSIDTTQVQTFSLSQTVAVATDWSVIEQFTVTINPNS